jgi:hypothetical protein
MDPKQEAPFVDELADHLLAQSLQRDLLGLRARGQRGTVAPTLQCQTEPSKKRPREQESSLASDSGSDDDGTSSAKCKSEGAGGTEGKTSGGGRCGDVLDCRVGTAPAQGWHHL